MIEYRGYKIFHDPPPIPSRDFDWQFCHDDYDGAEDSGDNRCGSGPDSEDCERQIDELIEEERWRRLVKQNLTEAYSGS